MGLETITCLICAIIFGFIKVEKTITIKQKVIESRLEGATMKIDSDSVPELKNEKIAKIWEHEEKIGREHYERMKNAR